MIVMNSCLVARCTFALLLFKFMQGFILLLQACTVSTHPPTTTRMINLCTFIMNRKLQSLVPTKLMTSYYSRF